MINEKQELFMLTYQTMLLIHQTRTNPDDGEFEVTRLANVAYQLKEAHRASELIPLDMNPFDAAHYMFYHQVVGALPDKYPDHDRQYCRDYCYWFMQD